MIEMKVSFDSDLQRAKEYTGQWAALALSAEKKVDVDDPVEMDRRAALLSAERAATRWIVSVDPNEDDEYAQLGFRHLVFHAPGPDQSAFPACLAAELLPGQRKTAVRSTRLNLAEQNRLPLVRSGQTCVAQLSVGESLN
jgi:coenzyme F420-dependent glucose-6-phosphate dehydrogenase